MGERELLKYKVIDLFAGAGGLSNGFEQTGNFEVIGAVEINKEAIETYNYNQEIKEDKIIRDETTNISDITKINFRKYVTEKNIDNRYLIVSGGPPCQGFSNSNRQKNYLISNNNQLVKQFARVIDEIRPAAFLMENVKTMNSKTHKFFATNENKEKYSSREHLEDVFGEKIEEHLREESLILIETNDYSLKSVINEILHINLSDPILSVPTSLSRVRSIIRKLNKSERMEISGKKEVNEILCAIEELKLYEIPEMKKQQELKNIILNVVNVLESVLNQADFSNKEALNQLQPFVTINQLLRYVKELKDEDILLVAGPEIKDMADQNKYVVKVQVETYNIVEYLEHFFEYIGYEINKGVVNSSQFFVPQKRERYMILGVRKKYRVNEVKLPQSYIGDKLPFTVYDAIADLEDIEPTKNVVECTLPYITNQTTKMKKYYRPSEKLNGKIFNHINTNSEELSIERFEYLNEHDGKNFHSLSEELKEKTYTNSKRTQNTVYLKLNYNVPSPTVINVRKSMWQHPKKIRAVSIREAARLQSFKDDYVFKGTKDKQYQQIGNAVPPLMARAVAESMLYALGDTPVHKLKDEFK